MKTYQQVCEAKQRFQAGTYRVYHGSPTKFTSFRPNASGKIWFTSSKAEATDLAGTDVPWFVYTADVTVARPDPQDLPKHTNPQSGKYDGCGIHFDDGIFYVVVFAPANVHLLRVDQLR